MSRTPKADMPGPDRRIVFEQAKETGIEACFTPDLVPPFPLVVEIGFGRGEFLIDLANESPEVAHLGVELAQRRVWKMARRIAKLPLSNLRIIEGRGEDVVAELLRPGSVARFWINFSDPWPKLRHHRRRLVQPPLVRVLAERLSPAGELHIATDHPPYAEWIDACLSSESSLSNVLAPEPFAAEIPGRRVTAYEDEWRREGRPLHFFVYRRHAGSAT